MELAYNRKSRLIIFLLRLTLGASLIEIAADVYLSSTILHQTLFWMITLLGISLILGFQVKVLSLLSGLIILMSAFVKCPVSGPYLFCLLFVCLCAFFLAQIDNHPLCVKTKKSKIPIGDGKIAVVTGANRGLGFEICRQLAKKGVRVILSARDELKGKQAVEDLAKDGLDVDFHQLDITDKRSVEGFSEYVRNIYGKLDILINNAGILIDSKDTVSTIDMDKMKKTFETNVCGSLLISRELMSLLEKSERGRIINLSSRMGALARMGSGAPAYRISKTALNALTRILAVELENTRIAVNSMTPGRINTEMGGQNAVRSSAEGADTAIWLALCDNPPNGKFILERKEIAW